MLAEELPLPAVQEQLHELEVRGDVAALQLQVELVDERLHLLRHAWREAAAARLQGEMRADDRRLQVAEESRRHGDGRDHLAVGELARRLRVGEAHERHLLRDVVDHGLDVEAMAADRDHLRQAVVVDERDARLRARVAGDEADEHRDDDGVRDERAEQQRRASQHAQVLAQQQEHRVHPNTSSTVNDAT